MLPKPSVSYTDLEIPTPEERAARKPPRKPKREREPTQPDMFRTIGGIHERFATAPAADPIEGQPRMSLTMAAIRARHFAPPAADPDATPRCPHTASLDLETEAEITSTADTSSTQRRGGFCGLFGQRDQGARVL